MKMITRFALMGVISSLLLVGCTPSESSPSKNGAQSNSSAPANGASGSASGTGPAASDSATSSS